MNVQKVASAAVCLALGLAALLSALSPEPSNAVGADTIIGKGKRGTVEFRFHVVITPSGTAQGEFFANNPGVFTITGKVDCGSVDGKKGVFGGSFDGGHFTVMVSDEPDGIIIGTERPNCDTSGFGVPIPITAGDITVVDR